MGQAILVDAAGSLTADRVVATEREGHGGRGNVAITVGDLIGEHLRTGAGPTASAVDQIAAGIDDQRTALAALADDLHRRDASPAIVAKAVVAGEVVDVADNLIDCRT